MAAAAVTDDPLASPLKRSSSFQWLPPDMSELRVVLLGNSWSQRCSVANLMLGETKFNSEDEPDVLRVKGMFKEKDIVLVNTPDLLHPKISEDKLAEHVKICVCLSDPGPHVFLLVLQPEDFNEEHKVKLCRILELFGDRSFYHSVVLISTPREESPGLMGVGVQNRLLDDMMALSRYRYPERSNLEHAELLTCLGQVAKENYGNYVGREVCKDEDEGLVMRQKSVFRLTRSDLNPALFWRRGAAAAEAGGQEEKPESPEEVRAGPKPPQVNRPRIRKTIYVIFVLYVLLSCYLLAMWLEL